MKYFVTILILLLACTAYTHTNDIDTLIIDLAAAEGGEFTIPVPASDKLKILIINKMPKHTYLVRLDRKNHPILPFNYTPQADPQDAEESTEVYIDECDSIILAYAEALNNAESEMEVAYTIMEMKQYLRTAGNGSPCNEKQKRMLNSLIAGTWKEIELEKVKKGEVIEVRISRLQSEEKRIEWKYTLETPRRGEWRTSYGFTFITDLLSEEEEFFLRQMDSTFTINKKKNNRWFDFAPTVMFTWYPGKFANSNWSFGLTGGLGFDFESPVVFIGPTASYNQNLNLHLGVAFHKQRHLNGIYEEGQILKEIITDEQLHEELYRLNPVISLSFRFSENPFNLGGS